jgi:cell division septum initiation protein DivIVA
MEEKEKSLDAILEKLGVLEKSLETIKEENKTLKTQNEELKTKMANFKVSSLEREIVPNKQPEEKIDFDFDI